MSPHKFFDVRILKIGQFEVSDFQSSIRATCYIFDWLLKNSKGNFSFTLRIGVSYKLFVENYCSVKKKFST